MSSGNGPIDQAALDELRQTVGDDEEFLGELIGQYLADSPALFSEMETALASGDMETLRRAAHSLKSTSASLGALRLASIAREIETGSHAGDVPGLAARLEAATREYALVEAALTARAAIDA